MKILPRLCAPWHGQPVALVWKSGRIKCKKVETKSMHEMPDNVAGNVQLLVLLKQSSVVGEGVGASSPQSSPLAPPLNASET